MTEKYNYELVVVDTSRGIAPSEAELKKVWQAILEKVAPNYRVVGVLIKENAGDDFP